MQAGDPPAEVAEQPAAEARASEPPTAGAQVPDAPSADPPAADPPAAADEPPAEEAAPETPAVASPEQLARYEELIERFVGGDYFSLDEEGKVAAWNAQAESHFGWAALEVVGEDFFEVLAPGARDELMPVVRGERGDGPAGRKLELETLGRDGDSIRTEVALVPIRVGDGYPLNTLLHDITTHRGNPVEQTRMRKRHAEVLSLIVMALDGGEMPAPLDLDEDSWQPDPDDNAHMWRPAGALAVFEASPVEQSDGERPAGDRPARPAEAAPARSHQPDDAELERLRDENHELRMKLREAGREAEMLRAELADARDRGAPGMSRPADPGDPSITPEHIKRALVDDAFTLHCQPVLDLKEDTISQHEVLLRMMGTDGELVLPQAFFGAARRAGLVGAIDQWVVRRSIRTIGEQATQGRDVRLEVNLSADALHDAGLLPAIERELASTGIDPGRLILEITEQIALADPEGARSLTKNLRAIGCGFALDDFGTSFGSFRFLKELPVDYLKIDGDLIVSLSESRTAQLVVKALVDVARGMGAQTIAVFASDEQTLHLLRELGVGYAQGHKVGRPQAI